MMVAINIERVKRQCQYNDNVSSGRIKGHPIYDWDVLIDGEYRAQFRPGVYKGYDLFDPDGFNIKGASQRSSFVRRSDVGAKAEFEGKILECLDKLLIPTLAQLAAARAKRQQEQDARDDARMEIMRVKRIQAAGPELLDALKAMVLVHRQQDTFGVMPADKAIAYGQAEAAIAKATSEELERQEQGEQS